MRYRITATVTRLRWSTRIPGGYARTVHDLPTFWVEALSPGNARAQAGELLGEYPRDTFDGHETVTLAARAEVPDA